MRDDRLKMGIIHIDPDYAEVASLIPHSVRIVDHAVKRFTATHLLTPNAPSPKTAEEKELIKFDFMHATKTGKKNIL